MRKLGRTAKHVLAMRTVLAVLLLSSIACAKNSEPVSCVQQAGAQQVAYPDGQARKSYVAHCSDGCQEFRAVETEGQSAAYSQVSFNSCERF